MAKFNACADGEVEMVGWTVSMERSGRLTSLAPLKRTALGTIANAPDHRSFLKSSNIWQNRNVSFQNMETAMDRLEAMSVVLAVAEAGSLSAAARLQKAPLTTVSRKVSELEAHLQTKLFNRSSRALVPTDAGRSYIAAAKRILADVADAERDASGEYMTPRGDLSVSAPVFLGRTHLQPVIVDFLKTFPDVDVQLGLGDRAVNLLGRAH